MTVTLALPSKGRLRDEAIERLRKAGYPIRLPENERRYRAAVDGLDGLEVTFLSASEIARELDRGNIDIGVTGEDLVRETIPDWETGVEISARLGFGRADVVVAVPEVWFDVSTMADLDDVAAEFRHRHGRRLRIATKYWRLTQQFFSQKHGIQVYRIVESLGATEGAPAAGSADVIVDITSTGSTLKANHLKVLEDGIILRSEACLVTAKKDRPAEDARLIAELAEAVAR
ncbi:ATP phosphoribosyltransferase [Chelativorans sp. SCAU2101]|uniref:ATP phosphoribosyltransferase n=1 Tax=Chelativorans petroleitrophicus TaxID=2975484 RepID=A0A9X2X7Q3_9HYPH|nr:ATP phosphoribosyltransferase [Chelativorans petroleitrophicus]MCT8990193.1 ATP phosphoribosyltransferase [Chelativorans petroleitrophicus]